MTLYCTEEFAGQRSPTGAGRAVSYARDAAVPSTASLVRASVPAANVSVGGTITKVPLTTWFRAMYLITQTKQGISSIELGRRLGTTQTTAWKIKTKLAEVMRTTGEGSKLFGRIEMDDAYLGGRQERRQDRPRQSSR